VADESVNNAVVAEKVLMLTAVAKDKAMVQADGGKLQEAAATLNQQKAELDAVYAAAPAAVQGQIRQETNNLLNFSGQLNGGAYDSATRKDMQSQSYNSRNSK
jgi:anti-sigma factor ChrR (cupin superfamily)